MTGESVYNTLLTWIRKDQRGKALNPDEFNRLSPIVNRKVLKAYGEKYEGDINSSTELGFLKVVGWTLNMTSGVATLPTNYYRLTGDPYYYITPTSRPTFIDIVTTKEHTYRERDYLTMATATYPTCTIGTQDAYGKLQIRVTPNNITPIKIDYLREPNTPYLDFYTNDTTFINTYLAVGANVTIPTGSTYRDGTTGTKASLSVDWEWSEDDMPLIIAFFLSALGIVIPDTLLLEAGMKEIILNS